MGPSVRPSARKLENQKYCGRIQSLEPFARSPAVFDCSQYRRARVSHLEVDNVGVDEKMKLCFAHISS